MKTLLDDQAREAFCNRLRELRHKGGWTQKEIAARLDIKNNHYSKYETGAHIPPLEKAILLADMHGVTLDYLIFGKLPDEQPVKSFRLMERFRVIEDFEPRDQDTIINVIDALIAKNSITDAMEPIPR